MKINRVRKLLAAALAASAVMASAMTVCASGSGEHPTVPSGSGEESAVVTWAETMSKGAGAPVRVAGKDVKTSVAGVYAAEKVQGVAVVTPLAAVKASLGLKEGQAPVIIIYDTDVKKSFRAMDSVNAAARAAGATVVACLNVDLGAKQDGRWVALSGGAVGLAAGLPKGADTGREYCVICVRPGGKVTVLADQDQDPATVTFEVQAGLGTYALAAK